MKRVCVKLDRADRRRLDALAQHYASRSDCLRHLIRCAVVRHGIVHGGVFTVLPAEHSIQLTLPPEKDHHE